MEGELRGTTCPNYGSLFSYPCFAARPSGKGEPSLLA